MQLLSDEDVFGTGPVAAQPQPTPLLSDEEVFGVGSASAADVWEPTLPQRLWEHTKEGFRNNLVGTAIESNKVGQYDEGVADVAGKALEIARAMNLDRGPSILELEDYFRKSGRPEEMSRMGGAVGTYAGIPLADIERKQQETLAQAEAKRTKNLPELKAARHRFETMRGVGDEEGVIDTLVHSAASVIGELVGGAPSPESLVPVSRGKTLLQTFLKGGAVNAATNTAVDPLIQQSQIETGVREEYDPMQTALSTLLGFGIGGTLNLTPEMYAGVKGIIARLRGKTPDTVTPDDLQGIDPEAILAEARKEGLPLDQVIAQQTGTDRPAPITDRRERGQRNRELDEIFGQDTVTRREDIDPVTGGVREGAQPVTEGATGTVLNTEELAIRRQARDAAREYLGREPDGAEIDLAEAYLAAGETPQGIARAFDRGYARQDGKLRETGDMRKDVAHERQQQFAKPAFDQADARRQRQAQTGGVDPQPGGRPSGFGPDENFTFLDAKVNRGEMSAGRQVEQTGQTRGADKDLEVEVRYIDDAGAPVTEWVTPDRLSTHSRPAQPRAAQDFADRAPKPPKGISIEGRPLERVTDRIGTNQRPATSPEPAPTPRDEVKVSPEEAAQIQGGDRRSDPARAGQPDRRTLRERIRRGEATAEEIEKVAYTDRLTGFQNRTAWDEAPKKAAAASIDLDNLTVVNNTMGHAGGDEMFRQFAQLLRDEGIDANEVYRLGGDEFSSQADDPAFLQKALENARKRAETATIKVTHPDGRTQTKQGFGFTFVVDKSYEAADAAIKAAKQARTKSGQRIDDPNKQHGDSGGQPVRAEAGGIDSGVVETPAPRKQSGADNPPEAVAAEATAPTPEPVKTKNAGADELIDELDAGRQSPEDDTPEPDIKPSADKAADKPADKDGDGVQLYSGIPVDVIAKKLASWAKGDADDWANTAERIRSLGDDVRKMLNQKDSRPGRLGVVSNILRTLVADTDANMRMLVKKYNSQTLKNLPNAFFARAGEGDGVAASLDERVSSHMNSRLIHVDKIAKFLRENRLTGRDTQQQIIKQLTSGKNTGGKVGEAVRKIQQFLADELKYLRDSGVDVGEAANYFPRMLDNGALVNNRGKFIQVARQIYEARGMSRDQAMAKAEAWWQNEVYGEGGTPAFQQGSGSATPSFLKPRELSDAESAKLREAGFYLDDINAVLGNYVMRATKRAEIAKTSVNTPAGKVTLGENFKNWEQIRKTIADEDPEALDVLPEIEKLIAVSAGVRNWNVGGKMQMASSWLRTWTTLATLEKATFSSMGELVLAPVRGSTGTIGDLGVTLRNLTTHFGALTRKMTGLPQSDRLQMAQELAEDIGVIAGEGHNAIMAARFAGGDPSGRVQSEVLNQFFRRILLEQLTNYTRVTSVDNAAVFVRRLAKQMEGSEGTKKVNRPSFFLRELGVPQGREADFAKFVRKFADKLPSAADLEKAGELGKFYRTAIQRFTDQTVMRPSASTKPVWANHPIGAVIFQLQSFGYAFQKNVLNRWGRIMKKSFMDKDSGLDATDGLAMVMPMLAGAAMVTGMQHLVGSVRDELYNKDRPDETTAAKVEKAMSRAGLFGIADPWIQAATGVRYQRSVSEGLLGPALGSVGSAADAALAASLNNSENTNTAERNVAKEFYEFGIEPLAQLALTLAPGTGLAGLLAKGASVYGIPKGRDEFVDSVAGEREDRKHKTRRGFSEMISGSSGESNSTQGGTRKAGRSGKRSLGREAGR